jgi:hypothetical protein
MAETMLGSKDVSEDPDTTELLVLITALKAKAERGAEAEKRLTHVCGNRIGLWSFGDGAGASQTKVEDDRLKKLVHEYWLWLIEGRE